MEFAALAVISLIGFGFATTAIALGVRSGSLRATIGKLSNDLNRSESSHATTREEFESYRARTKKQLEAQRDDITDYQDLLATCDDPGVLHAHLDGMLQKASRSLGDSSSD